MKKIGNRRVPFINYHKLGIFMITMNKLPDVSYFFSLHRNIYEPDIKKAIRPNYSDLGFVIFDCLKNFKNINPDLKILQYVIMPDHIHFLVEIQKEIDLALGKYLAIFKRKIYEVAEAKGLIKSSVKSIFELGFNDQFLRSNRSLDGFYRYIRENPYRLWVRFEYPERFRRIYNEKILGIDCDLYGNLSNLENPFLYPVVIHRVESPEMIKKKMELWEYVVLNGGILVGAFISEEEKKIRDFAFENDGRVILIMKEGFGKKEKPSGIFFEQCEKGNLLILSPNMVQVLGERRNFRQECLFMNSFAERISSSKLSRGQS